MAVDTRAMGARPIRPDEHRGVIAPNRRRKAIIAVGVGGENLGSDISIDRAHGVPDLIDVATKIDDSLDVQVGSHVVARRGDDDQWTGVIAFDVKHLARALLVEVVAFAPMRDRLEECVPAFRRLRQERQVIIALIQGRIRVAAILVQTYGAPDIARKPVTIGSDRSVRTGLPTRAAARLRCQIQALRCLDRSEANPVKRCPFACHGSDAICSGPPSPVAGVQCLQAVAPSHIDAASIPRAAVAAAPDR
jgi:hypothetical protein